MKYTVYLTNGSKVCFNSPLGYEIKDNVFSVLDTQNGIVIPLSNILWIDIKKGGINANKM